MLKKARLEFLPTMKLQLSQLPWIVGSGRVIARRAFFYASCRGLSIFLQYIQVIRRFC
jgi:hypothetical protein